MDSTTLNQFKVKLEQERERLLKNSKTAMEELTSNAMDGNGDEADEAAALSEAHLNMRFRDRERQLLDKINQALSRIKDGTFGECEDCGEDIGIKRLEIRPIATLCVKCKEIQEKKEGAFVCL